jgi:antitoxin VapB
MMADDEAELTARHDEVAAKLGLLRALLLRRGVDALLLTSVANTAWLTAGAATAVDESLETASFALLVTQNQARALTDPIEEPRLRAEERLNELGLGLIVEPWHARGQALRVIVAGKRLAADVALASGMSYVNLNDELVTLRSHLMAGEQARLRAGARLAAAAMDEVARAVPPGMTELEAAALLTAASRRRGGTATVTLVASDERIARFRHPLPTAKTIERQVMLVLCLRYRGLVSALTRTVSFGEPPAALRQLTAAVARVDARVIAATRPGRTLGEMYETLRAAYSAEGQPDAIEEHHQGGTIAYLARETFARPGSLARVEVGQAFAWNPSLRGAKSEDTLLLTETGPEIITASAGWPTLSIETDAGPIARPVTLIAPPA